MRAAWLENPQHYRLAACTSTGQMYSALGAQADSAETNVAGADTGELQLAEMVVTVQE